jgi:hypothetical protein
MLKFFNCIFLFFLCSLSPSAHSANYTQKPNTDKGIFDTEKLKNFKENEDFNYAENEEKSGLWTDFKEWLYSILKKFFGIGDDSGFWTAFFEILPYLAMLLFVVILVWYLVRFNMGSQIMRQHVKSNVTLTEEEELLMTKNLQELAEKAIEEKQYRLAVRYLYLDCIKRLDTKRLIRYTNDKTNFDYVREIQSNALSPHFKSLTISYEQIWYGQMVFDQVYFSRLVDYFTEFHHKLDQKSYGTA